MARFPVGLLSNHGGRTNGHKLSVTTESLSRFFYNHDSLHSIHPVKLDLRMFYLCRVPGLLADDFYT